MFALLGGALCIALAVPALYDLALHGEVSEITRTLSGWVILAQERKVSVSEVVAAYPPLPFVLLFLLQSLTDLAPAQANALLCAMLATGLGALWFRSLRKAGDSFAIAGALTFLIIANPLFLRIVAAGPHALLEILGFWVFARTVVTLRRFGDVDAMMLCSVSLIVMIMSGLFGALVALICALGIMIAFPGEIDWRHRPAVLLAVLFPVMLALAGLVFVNWILVHDGFAFVPENLRFGIDLHLAAWDLAPRTVLLACLACPVVLVAMFDQHTRGSSIVLLAYILFVVAAVALPLGLVSNPARAVSLALPIAAVVAEHWGREGHRLKILAGLLGVGLFGGFLAANADRPWSLAGHSGMIERAMPRYARKAADEALARHIAGQSDVMFDAAAHPAVVAALGSAQGLVTGKETAFQLALLRREPSTREVVVHAPDLLRNDDVISRTFPELYARGIPGYALEYDGGGWRVWTRRNAQEPTQ
jgi:hypothetical protein